MNNSFFIQANIKLNSESKNSIIGWPLDSNFRTSFWFKGESKTCPCEIRSDGNVIKTNFDYKVTIMLPQVDFLKMKLVPFAKFNIGVHSRPIGEGEIIKLISVPSESPQRDSAKGV